MIIIFSIVINLLLILHILRKRNYNPNMSINYSNETEENAGQIEIAVNHESTENL